MTVFVAGVHAVGKSYLCRYYSEVSGVTYESASSLIRKERTQAYWSLDKKVNNVDANQVALCNAVRRITSGGAKLLLDGHFVLINAQSDFVSLETSVFSKLNLSSVVLLEASPSLIASRLTDRDQSKSAVDIGAFISAERTHASAVCDELEIPLHILYEPGIEIFTKIISGLFESAEMEC